MKIMPSQQPFLMLGLNKTIPLPDRKGNFVGKHYLPMAAYANTAGR
jgi:hypothetical protein